jgi:taurine transport system permease protein
MGLSRIARGIFDPIIEFYRPIPPLALLPLIIIWMGIDDPAKIFLLFLAAFSIMVIASRSGVSTVKLSKIHAAYSLGASKWQVLRYVIFPNALPDIFTGMRVAMGVCWGTVVAAEMIAADRGLGFMVMVASKYMMTDLVVLGVIVMGLVGYLIDLVMRYFEAKLVPWKGKG